MFHSNRPLLIETYQVQQVVSAPKGGQFTVLGGRNGQGISVLDNAALFGTGSDAPGDSARFRSNGAVAPGSSGIAGVQGGWNLIVNFVPLGPFSGAGSAFGTAWYLGSTAQQDIGAFTGGSATWHNCGFAVDLLNRAPAGQGSLAAAVFAADPTPRSATVQSNTLSTCGETPRMTEIWCSVNNGNGNLVTGVPSPITAITGVTGLSSATLNTSIQQTFNLMNYPPMLNVSGQNGLNVSANAVNTISWSNTPLTDNYSGLSNNTVYIVPVSGLYFCHANFTLWPGATTGTALAGITVNGTRYFGGAYNIPSIPTVYPGCSVTRVLDLQKGDTVSAFINPTVAATYTTVAMPPSRLVMVWMDAIASSTLSWSPPEVTGFQFQAATPPGTGAGQLANIMNTKIANDVNFLLNRPYLMARQSTAQTGLTVNSFVSITMQTVAGVVHNSLGDNYGGWSAASNWYAAPVPGWYLAVAEIAAATTTTAPGQLTAGFSVPVSGGIASPASGGGQPDRYQALPVSSSTWPTGATAIGCYYLNTGEHIAPFAMWQSGASTTWSTDISHGFNSHFSVIWLSN